ncbi:MAG: undecaprenyl-phosphate glucose phosphotransferase [Lachnospiraceae bacterium]|nr:undecaprenyl-phosphate glucose phosphotransferase [Lachnospiraceae bacterium]
MIKDNQQVFNRLMCLLDALIAGGCFILGYVIKFHLLQNGPGVGVLPITSYYSILPFLVPGHLLILLLSDVYTPRRTGKSWYELWDVFRANTISMVILVIILFVVIHERPYSRAVLGIYYFLNMAVDFAYRILLRKVLRKFRSKGYNQKHILLVGYSRAAEAYMDRIRENPQWGVNVVGVLDDHVPAGASYHGVKVLGTLGNLEIILPENKLDEVAITLPLQDYDYLEHVVNICEKFGVHTKFIPDYNSVVPTRPYTEDVDGLPVINIRHVPLTNSGNIFIKRVVDIVGSLLGIILTSPIMLICAILIACTSRGPVIFAQERVGLHNKPFKMYKFRTMKVQTSASERKGWTRKNDPRVTKVGRVLRRTSIDELPQLFNILKGDMSLVGPRPERPQYVEKFMEEIPRYMVKHQVRPGLTGWAQVNGLRGDTSIRKRIEYDIYYIENWTMLFDIKIILMTFFTGFVNKNAY